MIFNLTQPVLNSAPKFTYTGTYEYIDDGGGNWRIKFLTSGTLTPLKAMTIDAFLVGGGGSGAVGTQSGVSSGGGGGYAETFKKIELTANTEYYIEIGAGGYLNNTAGMNKLGVTGGTTKAFGKSVPGGNGGGNGVNLTRGGDGGSGGGDPTGSGGVNGSDGTGAKAGSGQGKTTREFGEESGELYSSGGNGEKANPSDGNPNTGDGGGGRNYYSIKTSSGGSGIVIIRKHKEAAA